MRRLPVYLLLDTSGSMTGEPIESVKVGLSSMISVLRQDPHALETVHIAIITFDREVKLLTPLTALDEFQMPALEPPESGPTFLGEALQMLCGQVDKDIIKTTTEQKGDWKPLLFIMTDGKPSDVQKYNEAIPEVQRRSFAKIIACAAGAKGDPQALRKLTSDVVSLDTMDSNSFSAFFQWVSSTISSGNVSMGATTSLTLPPPPPEVNVVL